MGITIEAIVGGEPHPPYRVRVDLACEAPLCTRREAFEHYNGYVGCHALAMTAGWLERQTPQGRIWFCPRCSGK
jgi:hypothetical protein